MERKELERVLDLQQKAYELLLWISGQAKSNPSLLSQENIDKFRYADSCEEYVHHMKGIFPERLRPDEIDNSAFAHLLSSFFNTSFHVSTNPELGWKGTHWWDEHPIPTGERYLILKPGKPKEKRTKKAKERDAEVARNLQFIALEELAIENDIDLPPTKLKEVADQSHLQDALSLWSYAHELVRRAHFASQGAAVHYLWQSLDKKTREHLNAEVIWNAREQLVHALREASIAS
jgi:hypothetical protein